VQLLSNLRGQRGDQRLAAAVRHLR
jgi:hypothetical protein